MAKFVVRVREVETDVRTERVWEFDEEDAALSLVAKAKEFGFHAVLLTVRDKVREVV